MVRKTHSCDEDPDFAELLREAGMKATQPRLAIVRLLFHEHGPFTHEEIFNKVGARSDLNLTTVYRTTKALEAAGVINRCDFGDDSARFEFRGNIEASEHHHHVICRKCKRTESTELCLSQDWKKTLEKAGYRDVGHALEFFGTCRDCR